MANDFNNPTFKKTFSSTPSNQAPLRQWTVPDGEEEVQHGPANFDPEELAELERNVKAARREKVANENKISAPGKQRLEILANIGRLSKEVDVGGVKFLLRTLKTRETREVALAAFNPTFKTDLEASYEMRRQQLARSISKIDGHDISLVLGNDSFEARLAWIDGDLEESVALKLFSEMQSLNEQARTQFDIKTEEQAKEVAEDLKK